MANIKTWHFQLSTLFETVITTETEKCHQEDGRKPTYLLEALLRSVAKMSLSI